MENNPTGFTERLPVLVSVNDKLPRVGQWVMVVTPLLHSHGVIDADGVWRNVHNGDQIDDVQSWHLMDDPRST